MRTQTWRRLVTITLVVFFAIQLSLIESLASPFPFKSSKVTRGQKYNPATEITVNGTVENVDQKINRRGREATHLFIRTESGIFRVQLGPTEFLRSNNFYFSQGDGLQVTGSRIPHKRFDVLIAREIRKGAQILTLRDSFGRPAWSHHKRGFGFGRRRRFRWRF